MAAISTDDVLSWAFHQNYHADKANAAIHTSETRFSPLTFRLAEKLLAGCEHVNEVMKDQGKYPEDLGRIAEDKP